MITISILGLDQYAVGTYSLDNTKNLADLFEISTADINFYAPNCFYYHAGVDQTSWNTLIRIYAPRQFETLESKVADYLFKTLKHLTINVAVEFFYYDKKNRHESLNKDYPPFITEQNAIEVDEHGEDEEDDIYEGNIFEGIEEKIK
ncbi:MAG: hypothetical protein WC344_00215 [Bacilli bacterium]|jgi:hypothetical protein